ncbi:MAG: TetR/AcrR family transcriptional regulator [Chloroflexota bacterium]
MSNQTRQKILAKTSDLLERQGYHATGLNQIVKESSTPRGSIYYYFPDGKEELAVEAVSQRMDQMATFARHALNQKEDAVEAIVSFIELVAANMVKSNCCTGAPIAAVALETSNISEPIRNACAVGYQKLQDVFSAKLVMGGFTTDDAHSLASTLNSSFEGAMIMCRTRQDAEPLYHMAQNMRILLECVSERS